MKRLLSIAFILMLLLARPLAAQVGGRVEDEGGRPIAGASVELWAALRQVARATTGADGRFSFAAETAREATGVRVHAFGYAPGSAAVRAGDGELRIRLAAAPLAVAGVTAAVARRTCPRREEPEARALWERMRSRYAAPDALPAIEVLSDERSDEVAKEAIGRVDTLRARTGRFTNRGGVGNGTLDGAYARRVSYGALVHWEYAPLAWGFNQHFVRPEFGAAHELSVAARTADGVVVRFCPRDTREPGIEGTLTIGADTSLHAAKWRYRTSRPRDEAGGEAEYLPPGITDEKLLFADRALFWRLRPNGRYYFRHDSYREWRIAGAPVLTRPADPPR